MGSFWFAYFTVSRLGRIGRELERTRRAAARARGELPRGMSAAEKGASIGATVLILVLLIGIVSAGITAANSGQAGWNRWFSWFQTENMAIAAKHAAWVNGEVGVGDSVACDQRLDLKAMTAACREGALKGLQRYEQDKKDAAALAHGGKQIAK